MSKNKNTNQFGTFHIEGLGYKKNIRLLITALMVVIFVLGIGIVLFKNKPVKKQAVVQAFSNSIPGWWYQQYFGSSVCDKDNCKPDADPDKDGLSNQQEFFYHTDPLNAYTVKDKLNDGQLVALGFDPSRSGHMTFDQVTNPDTILGDSLVFNYDIKKLINESSDLTKIDVPQISDAELNLSKDNSQQAAATYLAGTKEILNKYLPKDLGAQIENAVKYQDASSTASISVNLLKAAAELKKLPVPPDFVQLHKYTIGFLQMLPGVLTVPPQDILLDDNNPIGNAWYDKTQATFSLFQKITLETNRLQNKYQNAK